MFVFGTRFVWKGGPPFPWLWRELLFLYLFQSNAFLLDLAQEFEGALVGAFGLGDELGGLLQRSRLAALLFKRQGGAYAVVGELPLLFGFGYVAFRLQVEE